MCFAGNDTELEKQFRFAVEFQQKWNFRFANSMLAEARRPSKTARNARNYINTPSRRRTHNTLACLFVLFVIKSNKYETEHVFVWKLAHLLCFVYIMSLHIELPMIS